MAGRILITGADGYLGHRIARRLLESGRSMVLWVRASDAVQFETKRCALERLLGIGTGTAEIAGRGATSSAGSGEVTFAWGDLRDAEPFAGVDASQIDRILHAAAVTRFNVDPETADQVNVEGTRKLLRFAERCTGIEAVHLLSTVYVSGLISGPIEEALLVERPAFSNHYERSKWEAEALFVRDFAHLPWQILRVATVIADDPSGTVTQQNAFHNTLKLLFYGLLSLVPGRPETPVYFVTGDFVVDSTAGFLERPAAGSVYHLAHARPESLTLGELIDLVYSTFQEDEEFRSRRILTPVFADEESFRLLVDGVRGFGGQVVNQAVSSVAPFAQQLFVDKEVRNTKLLAALGSNPAPEPRALLRRTSEFLVRTRWGRRALDEV